MPSCMKLWTLLLLFLIQEHLLITCRDPATGSGFSRRVLQEDSDDCPRSYAPYIASIRDIDGNHNCGALVIAENAVLTSAACVDRRIKSNLAEQPVIHIGGPNSDHPLQRRLGDQIFIHELWDGNPVNGYDLAIVRLSEPTCVWPVKHIGKRNPEQENFLVFGYGRTGATGTFSSRSLQGANVTIVSRSDCNTKFNVPARVGWGTACFKSTRGGSGICAGDEGGPIMHAPFSPVFEDSLIAVTSYRVGECDDPNSVAVATNIRRFKGWIKKTLNSDAFKGTEKDKKEDNVSSKSEVDVDNNGRRKNNGTDWHP